MYVYKTNSVVVAIYAFDNLYNLCYDVDIYVNQEKETQISSINFCKKLILFKFIIFWIKMLLKVILMYYASLLN